MAFVSLLIPLRIKNSIMLSNARLLLESREKILYCEERGVKLQIQIFFWDGRKVI